MSPDSAINIRRWRSASSCRGRWRGAAWSAATTRLPAAIRPTPTFSKCRRSRPISSRRARPGNCPIMSRRSASARDAAPGLIPAHSSASRRGISRSATRGRWAGYGALGAQINALGYEAGAFSDGGYDTNATTLAAAVTNTTTGSVAVASTAPWSPSTLGYANGTLFFRIDQEVIQGHYIDDTHVGIDVRGANGSSAAAHAASAPVLRF